MVFTHLLTGLIVGFALATPVGPIGVLCIRRTLAYGSRHGFIVGLSGASADIIYAIVAAFGITLISDFVTVGQHFIRLAGGILLLSLGFHTFRSSPTTNGTTNGTNRYSRVFASTFLLALTNPMTLFAFVALFSSLGVKKIMGDHFSLSLLVGGVFLGSLLWFSLLTSLAHIFKEKVTTRGIGVVNRVAGFFLMLFGAIALWSGLHGL